MDSRDKELIARLSEKNIVLKKLYREHEELEQKLSLFSNRTYLTPQEEVEEKQLKRQKLSGVDQMMEILEQHK